MAYVGCYLPILSWDRDSKNLRHASHIRAAGGGRLRLRNGFGFATNTALASQRLRLRHMTKCCTTLPGGLTAPPHTGEVKGLRTSSRVPGRSARLSFPYLPPSVLF